MDQNILLSKIVANPTENTWAQAYSTLNLYVVLSVRSGNEEAGIVTQGKELLERIQREYFSLDEKTTMNIKEALNRSLEGFDLASVSIVLATLQDDVLYLIIANEGEAILKRGRKIGSIAKGEPGEIVAYSGNIDPDDVVVIETGGFSQKVPIDKLSGILDDLEVTEISEQLAPLIHEESKGSEAAIILKYKTIETSTATTGGTISSQENESIEELGHAARGPRISFAQIKIPKLPISLSAIGSIGLTVARLGKRKLILVVLVLLIFFLAFTILLEKQRQERSERQKILTEILTPAQRRFDEAESLISLNKGLAYEEFDSLKTSLDEVRGKLAENTAERKKLDEFIGKVEEKIGELSQGVSIANQKVVYENVEVVSFRDGQLAAIDTEGKLALLTPDGKVEREIDSDNANARSFVTSDQYVYILGDAGITRITKSSKSITTIVEDPKDTIDIDNFGTNIYGLNSRTKTIDKYVGSARSDYFIEDITLTNPVSMSIDASIWVIDGSKIRKFTRGKEDSFSVKGLTRSLGSGSKIFTAPDYSNIYILDHKNARIVSIKKDGEFENQYSWKNLAQATSFSVDEAGEVIYAVINNKLYSFDL